MGEAGGFLEDYCSGEDYEEFQKLIIEPGFYEVSYAYSLRNKENLVDLYFKKIDFCDNSKVKKILLI